MNRVVTIADKAYHKFAHRLHASVRDAGWRGNFTVVTTDDDFYCNCDIVRVDREIRPNILNDNRWLQFELLDFFDEGDRILYLDADMIALEDCDFDFMFENDFLLSTVPVELLDVTNELPDMTAVLGFEVEFKYIMSPAVFTVGDKRAHNLLRGAIQAIPYSEKYRRGSLFAFNISAYQTEGFDPTIFPKEKVVYSVDINLGHKFDYPWFVHYGGNIGRKQWDEEYGGKDLGYLL